MYMEREREREVPFMNVYRRKMLAVSNVGMEMSIHVMTVLIFVTPEKDGILK